MAYYARIPLRRKSLVTQKFVYYCRNVLIRDSNLTVKEVCNLIGFTPMAFWYYEKGSSDLEGGNKNALVWKLCEKCKLDPFYFSDYQPYIIIDPSYNSPGLQIIKLLVHFYEHYDRSAFITLSSAFAQLLQKELCITPDIRIQTNEARIDFVYKTYNFCIKIRYVINRILISYSSSHRVELKDSEEFNYEFCLDFIKHMKYIIDPNNIKPKIKIKTNYE